uniref:cullin-RING-type E3 NEDD8 transferase n=1 Tax=Astyanax mexicanus TaxID=7994 RepID=A0A8B9HAP3_ASTMX
MTSAVITYCGHFFHGNCLRKWLYVQETCPMCHTSIKPTSTPTAPAGDAHPHPTQPQANPPQQEALSEPEEEQDPHEDGDHSPEEKSESLDRRTHLQESLFMSFSPVDHMDFLSH